MRIVVVEDNELYRDELLQCLEQEESCLLYTSHSRKVCETCSSEALL